DAAKAIALCNEWAGKPLPISATCHLDGRLYVRLSGVEVAIEAARALLGSEMFDDPAFWISIRDHAHPFFTRAETLWRVSVPSTTPPLRVASPQLMEWGGALRWIAGDLDSTVREHIAAAGGHVTRFRGADRSTSAFPLLPAALFELHRRLKQVFDPA